MHQSSKEGNVYVVGDENATIEKCNEASSSKKDKSRSMLFRHVANLFPFLTHFHGEQHKTHSFSAARHIRPAPASHRHIKVLEPGSSDWVSKAFQAFGFNTITGEGTKTRMYKVE